MQAVFLAHGVLCDLRKLRNLAYRLRRLHFMWSKILRILVLLRAGDVSGIRCVTKSYGSYESCTPGMSLARSVDES